MFPLGQPLELSVTDADSSGVLQDPGGLSLIVEPPQGGVYDLYVPWVDHQGFAGDL